MTREQLEDLQQYVGRTLTSREISIVETNLQLGFDFDCILYALNISVDMLCKYSFRYAEGVLMNWEKHGCKTVAEVKAYMAAQEKREKLDKKSGVIFKDACHKQRCREILGRMKSRDVYHAALAYLLALDNNIEGQRISECFDFSEDSIKPNVLEAAWVTGTDRRVLKLGFNLWNDAQQANVSDVFGAGSDLEYLIEAVRIRFGAAELIL